MRRRAQRDGRLRRAVFSLPWVLLSVMAGRHADATISYDVSAGVSETDNVRLTPTDTRSDTIATVGLDLDLHEQLRTFDADVVADLDYLHYLRDTYGPEVVGNFMGNARYSIIPDKLTWDVADSFGQSQINPLAQVTPDNRENVNYFTTGPDLALPLWSTFDALLDGRYSNVSYQKSPLSSNRYTGGAGLRDELSPSSSVSINIQDEIIRFENDLLNPDYDQQEAYFRYNVHGIRTRLDVEVGVERLKLANGSTNEPMFRAEATRQIAASSSLTATVGHEFSDAGDDFRLLQTLNGANLRTQAVQPTSDPFKNNYVTLGWAYTRQRTGAGVTLGYYSQSYIESDALNEHRSSVEAHISRRLTPSLEAALQGNYERDNFQNITGNSSLFTGTARLTWRASRRINIVTEYDYSRRESQLKTTEYTDDVLWVKLTYGRTAPPPTGTVVPKLPVVPGESGY